MHDYRSNAPKPLFALTAVVMGILVTSLAVVAPATYGPAHDATRAATRAATEVAIVPSRIEVFGVREALAAEGDSQAVARADEHLERARPQGG